MDYTVDGFAFTFEFDKVRLLYGKYNYVAKFLKVLDLEAETVVPTDPYLEAYGRDESDARKAAEAKAREWVAERRKALS